MMNDDWKHANTYVRDTLNEILRRLQGLETAGEDVPKVQYGENGKYFDVSDKDLLDEYVDTIGLLFSGRIEELGQNLLQKERRDEILYRMRNG